MLRAAKQPEQRGVPELRTRGSCMPMRRAAVWPMLHGCADSFSTDLERPASDCCPVLCVLEFGVACRTAAMATAGKAQNRWVHALALNPMLMSLAGSIRAGLIGAGRCHSWIADGVWFALVLSPAMGALFGTPALSMKLVSALSATLMIRQWLQDVTVRPSGPVQLQNCYPLAQFSMP